MLFDGFLAFACPVRVDTPDVVKALRASSHTVMMATGDSALTALHVANDVGIAEGGLAKALMLAVERDASSGEERLEWVCAETDEKTNRPTSRTPYASDGTIPELAKRFSLCVTGEALNAAARVDGVSLGKDSGREDKRGLGGGKGGLWDSLDRWYFRAHEPGRRGARPEAAQAAGTAHVHVRRRRERRRRAQAGARRRRPAQRLRRRQHEERAGGGKRGRGRGGEEARRRRGPPRARRADAAKAETYGRNKIA